MTAYTVGTLAYIDSFGGPIPCTVVRIWDCGEPDAFGCTVRIAVRPNVTRGGYRKGDVVERTPHHVPPRKQCHRHDGHYRIDGHYYYVPEEA